MPHTTRRTAAQANRFAAAALTPDWRFSRKCAAASVYPVLTDVHTEQDVARAAAVVDVLQTPAFLCRHTDFIQACARSGKPVNIKKGQFLSPYEMKNVIDKARAAARAADLDENRFLACE